MTGEAQPLDLGRQRPLGPLFGDALRIYVAHFPKLVAIGAAVVVPAELIVLGVGLGELGAGSAEKRPLVAELVPAALQALVIGPLLVAMTIHVLLELSGGRRPGIRVAIQSGLDAFAAVFVPVLAVIAFLAFVTFAVVLPLALAVSSALVPTLLVPLALFVRWYFVPHAVVAAGARRLDALRTSWDMTRGAGLRVFGVVLLAQLAFTTAASVVGTPLFAAARSADSGALVLASRMVGDTLAAPAFALVSALLFFDLRARRRPAPA